MQPIPFEVTDPTEEPLPDWWLELPTFERANRIADFLKTGRNDSCPCGSGKKYKPEVKPTKATSGGDVSLRIATTLAALAQNK